MYWDLINTWRNLLHFFPRFSLVLLTFTHLVLLHSRVSAVHPCRHNCLPSLFTFLRFISVPLSILFFFFLLSHPSYLCTPHLSPPYIPIVHLTSPFTFLRCTFVSLLSIFFFFSFYLFLVTFYTSSWSIIYPDSPTSSSQRWPTSPFTSSVACIPSPSPRRVPADRHMLRTSRPDTHVLLHVSGCSI